MGNRYSDGYDAGHSDAQDEFEGEISALKDIVSDLKHTVKRLEAELETIKKERTLLLDSLTHTVNFIVSIKGIDSKIDNAIMHSRRLMDTFALVFKAGLMRVDLFDKHIDRHSDRSEDGS